MFPGKRFFIITLFVLDLIISCVPAYSAKSVKEGRQVKIMFETAANLQLPLGHNHTL